MKRTRLSRRFFKTLALLIAPVWVACTSVLAQSAAYPTSNIVGFTRSGLSTNSDTILAPFFLMPAAFSGAVSSVATSSATATLSLPTASFKQGALSPASNSTVSYFVYVSSGSLRGNIFEILTNGASSNGLVSVSVALGGVSVPTNGITRIDIRQAQTLSSLLPSSLVNVSFLTNAGSASSVFIPNLSASGTNLPPAAQAVYNGSKSNWYSTNGVTNLGLTSILPGDFVILRNSASGSVSAASLSTIQYGEVLTNPLVFYVSTRTNGAQDTPFALPVPFSNSLSSLGLGTNAVSSSSGFSGSALKDVLLVFPPSGSVDRYPTSPAKSYALIGTNWYDTSSTNSPVNPVFAAGSALIVRKAPSSTGASLSFTNQPLVP